MKDYLNKDRYTIDNYSISIKLYNDRIYFKVINNDDNMIYVKNIYEKIHVIYLSGKHDYIDFTKIDDKCGMITRFHIFIRAFEEKKVKIEEFKLIIQSVQLSFYCVDIQIDLKKKGLSQKREMIKTISSLTNKIDDLNELIKNMSYIKMGYFFDKNGKIDRNKTIYKSINDTELVLYNNDKYDIGERNIILFDRIELFHRLESLTINGYLTDEMFNSMYNKSVKNLTINNDIYSKDFKSLKNLYINFPNLEKVSISNMHNFQEHTSELGSKIKEIEFINCSYLADCYSCREYCKEHNVIFNIKNNKN